MNPRASSNDISAGPDLVILGNLLVDDIVFRDGSTLVSEPGGAILHAALAARLWGINVGLVSVVGDDYPASALDALQERGIDLAGVRPLNRPGGRVWLLHEAEVRHIVHHLGRPTHDQLSPTMGDIPASYEATKFFHLAPMPIVRQKQLADGLSTRSKFVSLDPCELLLDENLEHWSTVLEHVNAFFPSEDEVLLTGDAESSLRQAASARMRYLALKRGIRGGRLLDLHNGSIAEWIARATHTVDATGAGDAFVAGFLAGLIQFDDVQRGIELGIVSASFALEDWGARGLLAASPEQAQARWETWFGSRATADCRAL